MITLPTLDSTTFDFPDPNTALIEPNGLLALGGDLHHERLLKAYQQGIFPWYNESDPLCWWSPDPRCILFPNRFNCSKSLKKSLSKTNIHVTENQAFTEVIKACSEPRANESGTWIHADMIQAYTELHRQGQAMSIEVWDGDTLVGGLYGVTLARVFCGESMFSRQTDASKIALYHLCQIAANHGWAIIDCQLPNPHLATLGAEVIPRQVFLSYL